MLRIPRLDHAGLPTLESSQIQIWLFKIRLNTSLSFQHTPEIRKYTCKTANLIRINHTLMTSVDQITIISIFESQIHKS